jgi:SOS-response transcriptional repressor LexA
MNNNRAPLTESQKRVYGFIVEYIKKYKYPPTIREIQDNFGLKSSNSVVAQIKKLKEKGYITNSSAKGKMTARTLQLVDDIIGNHTIESDELSEALADMKEKGYSIGAKEAVELLSRLNIRIQS